MFVLCSLPSMCIFSCLRESDTTVDFGCTRACTVKEKGIISQKTVDTLQKCV